ncbi:MAG: acyltransferase [Lachnospiraceae bacterium]|nr:acyltransferase [Lachnospiraceae bacterium]
MNIIKKCYCYVRDVYIKKRYIGRRFRKSYGSFGEHSCIHRPFIYDNNRKLIHIGKETTILEHSRIQLYPERVNQTPHIYIGDGCYIGYYFSILAGADVRIGNHVLVASHVLISSENHGINPESEIEYMEQPLTGASVVIEDGCWIGENVCILPGVTIGKKSIIGSGSVVTKSVPPYCIAAGNPARIIKKYNFTSHQWEKCDVT